MKRLGVAMGSLALMLTGCGTSEPRPNISPDQAAIARGRAAAEALGCGACHVLPDIVWPRGTVGPSLERFAVRALIAGHLPNRPHLLAAFLRDPPRLVPDSGMPKVAMTERQARDIAAWLQSDDDR